MSDIITPVEEEEPIVDPVVEDPDLPNTEESTDVLEMSDEDFDEVIGDLEDADYKENSVESEDLVDGIDDTAEGGDSGTAEVTEPVTEEVIEGAAPKEPVTEEVKPVEEAPVVKEAPTSSSMVDPLTVPDSEALSTYKEVFAPFKANGKTIQVRNADEARRLMQMGAGYTKTMMEMRPHRAVAQTLKNNNIGTDELNYLIELKNGNPDAIKKLVRDTGIDPFDIVVDDASKAADAKYRPKDYSASETQINFETTLAEVGSLPGGTELLQSVYKDWDETSQTQIYEDPNTLRVLTVHKENGIYDAVSEQVDRERILGHLSGVTFLDAYTQVAQAMDAKGLLGNNAAPAAQATETVTKTTSTPVIAAVPEVLDRQVAAPKAVSNTARAKALAPVKAGSPAKAAPVNPMNMSDADFENIEGLANIIG